MWSKKTKKDDEKWEDINREVARLTKEKKVNEALNFAQELFDYTKKYYGKKHKKTIVALNNLGIINILRKDFDEAEAYLLLALQLSEKMSGKHTEQTSMINMNLSKLYSARAIVINDINEFWDRTSIKDELKN